MVIFIQWCKWSCKNYEFNIKTSPMLHVLWHLLVGVWHCLDSDGFDQSQWPKSDHAWRSSWSLCSHIFPGQQSGQPWHEDLEEGVPTSLADFLLDYVPLLDHTAHNSNCQNGSSLASHLLGTCLLCHIFMLETHVEAVQAHDQTKTTGRK